MRFRHTVWAMGTLVLSVGISLAQSNNSCPAIVERALAAVDEFCQDAGRNQACYGNVSLTATAQAGVDDFQFEDVGDIEDVSDIQSLILSGMDEAEGKWGVALMRLQANLPDTFPGQGVTFLLFGDVSIEDASADEQNPMQAFILKTGIGDAPCQEAPSSGLIVQTPEGAGQIALNVNGVDISMGSTVLFRSKVGEEMTVSTLEGAAVVVVDNVVYPIVEGSWLRTPMTPDGDIAAPPALPVAYRAEPLQALPLTVLDREIQAREPLNELELARLHERLRAGEMPCGETGFPDCSHFPDPEEVERLGWRLARERDFGAPLPMPPQRQGANPNERLIGPNVPNNPNNAPLNLQGTPNAPQPPAFVDDRPCVYPPGPNDPPLPANETRPFCPTPAPGQQASPPPNFPPPPANNPPAGGGDDDDDDDGGNNDDD